MQITNATNLFVDKKMVGLERMVTDGARTKIIFDKRWNKFCWWYYNGWRLKNLFDFHCTTHTCSFQLSPLLHNFLNNNFFNVRTTTCPTTCQLFHKLKQRFSILANDSILIHTFNWNFRSVKCLQIMNYKYFLWSVHLVEKRNAEIAKWIINLNWRRQLRKPKLKFGYKNVKSNA